MSTYGKARINLHLRMYQPSGAALLSFCVLFTALACTPQTRLQVLAFAVKTAVEELSEQRVDTLEAFSAAAEARNEITRDPTLSFSSPKTQDFIDRWKTAESEVRALRRQYNDTLKEADFFFAYAEKKNALIRDSELRERTARAISNKKASFTTEALGSHSAITDLERTIEKGNDMIAALEIAGVLGSISKEVVELRALQERALGKTADIEKLINEGGGLLELELRAVES